MRQPIPRSLAIGMLAIFVVLLLAYPIYDLVRFSTARPASITVVECTGRSSTYILGRGCDATWTYADGGSGEGTLTTRSHQPGEHIDGWATGSSAASVRWIWLLAPVLIPAFFGAAFWRNRARRARTARRRSAGNA